MQSLRERLGRHDTFVALAVVEELWGGFPILALLLLGQLDGVGEEQTFQGGDRRDEELTPRLVWSQRMDWTVTRWRWDPLTQRVDEVDQSSSLVLVSQVQNRYGVDEKRIKRRSERYVICRSKRLDSEVGTRIC